MEHYKKLIREYSKKIYKNITREAGGYLNYPFIVPGRAYARQLWDWDSWLTDIAIRQIMLDDNIPLSEYEKYEKGCILNFLENTNKNGKMPILISSDKGKEWIDSGTNMHKPCIAQHIAFIVQNSDGDTEWFEKYFDVLKKFIGNYMTNQRDENTGLYFWLDDFAIGVDNDPTCFYRAQKSNASVYLNCMMYTELKAMHYLCGLLNECTDYYEAEAEKLKNAVNKYLWDERNGFYYSTDLNLLPIDNNSWLHSGMPRHWHSLIQKIDVWSGFMAMWSEIASPQRAERMVNENMLCERTFWSNFGVRSLSKCEQMYRVTASSNPSCWTGPVWGVVNYVCFRSLLKYGYIDIAKRLAEKTVRLYGRDIEISGEMHEYYDPDSGIGVCNPDFQSWNLLVNNMIAWLDGKKVLNEF